MADTTLPGVLLKGIASSRPSASAVAKGTIYSATDTGAISQSDGSSWSTYATISSGLADPMTTRGDIIVRNSSNTTARLGIGSTGKVLSSDGTDISWQTPAAGGTGLLAVSAYQGSGGDTTYSTTSGSFVDVDASNVVVTFTAPASGNVLVRVTVPSATSTDGVFFCMRESTTNLGRTLVGSSTAIVSHSVPIYLTGLSAGSHTYKLGWLCLSGGTATIYYGNTTRGPVVLEVWSAP